MANISKIVKLWFFASHLLVCFPKKNIYHNHVGSEKSRFSKQVNKIWKWMWVGDEKNIGFPSRARFRIFTTWRTVTKLSGYLANNHCEIDILRVISNHLSTSLGGVLPIFHPRDPPQNPKVTINTDKITRFGSAGLSWVKREMAP